MSKKAKETKGQPLIEVSVQMDPENKIAAFDVITEKSAEVDDWKQKWDKDKARSLKSKKGYDTAALELSEMIRNFRSGGEQPLFEEGEDPDLSDVDDGD